MTDAIQQLIQLITAFPSPVEEKAPILRLLQQEKVSEADLDKVLDWLDAASAAAREKIMDRRLQLEKEVEELEREYNDKRRALEAEFKRLSDQVAKDTEQEQIEAIRKQIAL
ncbi:MAG TPA: hypothetical protein VEA59_01730 [Patescibacteria group bacterium]|nr:hypothetical protein [Patescibacteria group bacterium]